MLKLRSEPSCVEFSSFPPKFFGLDASQPSEKRPRPPEALSDIIELDARLSCGLR
jgi:hypothetical protein